MRFLKTMRFSAVLLLTIVSVGLVPQQARAQQTGTDTAQDTPQPTQITIDEPDVPVGHFDPADYAVRPLPIWQPPGVTTGTEHFLQVHDLQSSQTTIVETVQGPGPLFDFVAGGQGFAPDAGQRESTALECPRSPHGSRPPSPTATRSKATSAKAAWRTFSTTRLGRRFRTSAQRPRCEGREVAWGRY